MAEETAAVENTEQGKSSIVKMLAVPLIVGVVCAGIGFAVPMLFPALVGAGPEATESTTVDPLFIKYGEVVVNLNDARLTRYLRIGISLQITAAVEDEPKLQERIEKKRAILTSWLLAYLADMSMEDIRGAAGQNRLRREINDHFNWVLFPEGEYQVDDVLFEEFNVQ